MIDHSFHPWEELGPVVVPTPWALEACGVPAHAVEVPWVAAADYESWQVSAQVMAALRIKQAQLAMQRQLAPPQNTYADYMNAAKAHVFEGPRVVFVCTGCDNSWDAWTDDAGHLEDPRDAMCSEPTCDRFGKPAEHEEDN